MQFIDTYDKIDRAIANVAAIREAVGPHFGIGVDFHGRVHKPMAKVLGARVAVKPPTPVDKMVCPGTACPIPLV